MTMSKTMNTYDTESKQITPIQTLITPGKTLCSIQEMYIRGSGKVRTPLSNNHIHFMERGTKITTDTFYNGLSVGVWKKYCKIDALGFLLRGEGKFQIRFGLHRRFMAHQWLWEGELELVRESAGYIMLPFWQSLEDGLLYCEITSLTSDAWLTGASFFTTDAPLHDVKLGLVITHFNRQKQAATAISRIRTELLEDTSYENKCSLFVIDNSRNLDIDGRDNIRIIKNKNYGGSGGFARGLLEIINDGSYTHCLFMDDDASCEIESIRRTIAIFQYGTQEKLAVGGSLLREVEPYRLFEKGALFDGACRPLKSGLDMRHIPDLIEAEHMDTPPSYGGWWFFGFSLADITHYPFPFFVRGDDSQFSILNKLTVATMNGVASFGDDFGLKNGPVTTYLDARYHIVNSIIYNLSTARILKIAAHAFIAATFSYNYESARSVILGLKHALLGPKFFKENPDASHIIKKISSFMQTERLQKPQHNWKAGARSVTVIKEPAYRTLIRWVTLNGHLVPFLLKSGTVIQPKSFRAKFREVFGYKNVLYIYEPLGLGYLATIKPAPFWRLAFEFSGAFLKLAVNLPRLRKEYKSALNELTGPGYWRAVYGMPTDLNNANSTPAIPELTEKEKVV